MNAVSGFIRSLPKPVEFAIVIAVAFGLSIVYSIEALANPPLAYEYDGESLRSLVIEEVLILLGLGWFLLVRGWDFAGQPLYPSLNEWGAGLMLTLLVFVGWELWIGALWAMQPDLSAPALMTRPDWAAIIAVSILNPIFEELFVCAYVITALRPFGLTTAVLVSVLIRTSYHLYQGLPSAVFIGLMGLLFALWFVRTRSLWPVVIAHGALDLTGFAGTIAS